MRKPIHKAGFGGFALIVTLSLMILLTVVAVGLLTLSSISLRSSSQGAALAIAQSNARLALMLAVGELQKTAGPDQRITAPANLRIPAAGPGITGVWKSWRPPSTNPDYTAAKSGTNFLGFLMSNPTPAVAADSKVLPTGTLTQKLVGPGSVGITDPNRQISAPMVAVAGAAGKSASGRISWVVLDEGVKGRIDLAPAKAPDGQGEAITQVGAPPRNGIEAVPDLQFLAATTAGEIQTLRESLLPKLVSLKQTGLGAAKPDAMQPYFHDFTVSSNSVQADVANGGLKTDLSVLFEGDYDSKLPAAYADRFLYSDTSTPFQGATSDSQWGLYANYSRLYRRTTANDNPKDGLKATLPAGYSLKTIADMTLKRDRYEPDMAKVKVPDLMPTVERVDTVFSLVARDANRGFTAYKVLHLMYLPVVTLHNPYNVPLRVTGLKVDFSDIPVGFRFFVGGQPVTTSDLVPINDMYLANKAQTGKVKSFNMSLLGKLSGLDEVFMGPGETKIFGTPFSKDTTWSSAGTMSDWSSNAATVSKLAPGMITGPTDGIGFDIDLLAPIPGDFSPWFKLRETTGGPGGKSMLTPYGNAQIHLKPGEDIKVEFGPKAPVTANNAFTITVSLGSTAAGKTQVFYMSDARLKTVMEEGTSPRFPNPRSFPATYPDASSPPIKTESIYESDGTKVQDYVHAKPFAIFSVGAKTTVESFTKSRPVADTGVAYQMATCDLTSSATQGASPLEFALVPQSSSSAIQSGGAKGDQGFSFGGQGSTHGTTAATIYEIPMAPLQSIAQLRHANGGSIGSVPYVTYSVGESRAHPAVPSSAVFYKPDASRTVLDHSWLANDQLWDRYWFSTLSSLQGTGYAATVTQKALAEEFFAGTRELPNSRNALLHAVGKDAATTATGADGKQSAMYVLTKGGFNVNSTSVAAWVAVLSSLATSDVPLAAGSSDKDPAGTPFLRVRQPSGGLSAGLSGKEKLWTGYRTLTAAEIQILATKIVAEIRSRGPFLSMSEFVNRRLGAPDVLTNSGAVQAALDQSGVNAIMESNARPIAPADVANFGWQNPDAVTGNTGAGSPGEISQGDVLSAIGSFVSVRSDTFRIRAYGNALDASGKVTAQVWCEATLQRVPEYVDTADLPAAPATTPANLTFGRQFKTISFRWLSPSEV